MLSQWLLCELLETAYLAFTAEHMKVAFYLLGLPRAWWGRITNRVGRLRTTAAATTQLPERPPPTTPVSPLRPPLRPPRGLSGFPRPPRVSLRARAPQVLELEAGLSFGDADALLLIRNSLGKEGGASIIAASRLCGRLRLRLHSVDVASDWEG